MNLKAIPDLFKRSLTDWNDDNCTRLGASLAFYTIMSISPLVLFVIAIVSIFLSRSTAQAELLNEVQATIGPQGRTAVQSMLAGSEKASAGIFATLIGIATLLYGASYVFGELRSALNTIWGATPKQSSGVVAYLRERFFSFGMVLSVGFLLLASLLVSTALAVISKFAAEHLPIPASVLAVANFLISFFGIALLFGLIFKYVPETKVEWADVRLGALATALLFTIGKSLLGLYLGKASPGSAYGAAGSLVVLVLWVYYSAQIFYFGAEFTHIYSLFRNGTLPPPGSASKSLNPPQQAR